MMASATRARSPPDSELARRGLPALKPESSQVSLDASAFPLWPQRGDHIVQRAVERHLRRDPHVASTDRDDRIPRLRSVAWSSQRARAVDFPAGHAAPMIDTSTSPDRLHSQGSAEAAGMRAWRRSAKTHACVEVLGADAA